MNNFNILVTELLIELANVAGGADSVTGPVTSGDYGNQFPSQNSKAYNDGNNLPVAPADLILGKKAVKKRKSGKKSKVKIPMQRRTFPTM